MSGIIAGVFSLIFFGAIVYMVYGLFKKEQRKTYLKRGGLAALVSFVGIGIFAPDTQTENLKTPVQPTEVTHDSLAVTETGNNSSKKSGYHDLGEIPDRYDEYLENVKIANQLWLELLEIKNNQQFKSECLATSFPKAHNWEQQRFTFYKSIKTDMWEMSNRKKLIAPTVTDEAGNPILLAQITHWMYPIAKQWCGLSKEDNSKEVSYIHQYFGTK